ncbi:carbohydrate kinase [Mesorhizobium sp. BAC0120]|uniref:FGGY-family carbohydrate kinase n=1 Tax=Mesorhizobium sp. BAC0120 TaxID=3090670 RepID=UPI00298C8C3E|nr:carbohydrate kinase [Mesorhizobium sp. BAC0120]MDW6024160.1 carbohydrate kinase [Mesorhizobium sp. BAC0120]
MRPRGTLVLDIGSTNTKLMLFDGDGRPLRERRAESRHLAGPPYRSLDPEPALAILAETLPEFDRTLPVDAIVPCAHGSALALLDGAGELALPVMDYLAEPPPGIVDAYRRIAPPFSEVFCPLNPMALTLGLQLFWQETAFPEAFAQVRTILPWGQYFAFRLTGRAVAGYTELGAQTQLVDVTANGCSSLSRERGWDRLLAPQAPPFETVGTLKPEFRISQLSGRAEVKAGIHDSNANYLRYLAAGLGSFTLLSTGTWIIIFDTRSDFRHLDPARDTATNIDAFGRPVACSRFMGGHEIAAIEAGAPQAAATSADLANLVRRRTFALPSFTDSGGPMPGTGGKGRIIGPQPRTAGERAALGALYCALMTDQSLDAVGSESEIVIDGPFGENALFCAALAGLRAPQRVFRSDLRDGTAAGAALVAHMSGKHDLPRLKVDLAPVDAFPDVDLPAYRTEWLSRSSDFSC